MESEKPARGQERLDPPNEWIEEAIREIMKKPYMRRMNEFAAKGQGAEKHASLTSEQQEINRHIIIHPAGYSEEGDFLGLDALLRDLRVAALIERTHVVDAQDIAEQVRHFYAALMQAGGDPFLLDAREFKFMQMGGHVSEVPLSILQDMCTKNGYVLLAEYKKDDVSIPMGYSTGFAPSPHRDPTYPTLDTAEIQGDDDGYFDRNYYKIWTIWRAGVVRSIDERFAADLKTISCDVPPGMVGMPGQKRGINNAFKPVIAEAAKSMHYEVILYNTARMRLPRNPLHTAMPNMAIRGSNEGVFQPLHGFIRNKVDALLDVQGQPIVKVNWDIFAASPASVLQSESKADSVLMTKGGWDIDKLRGWGKVLLSILQRRYEVRNAIEGTKSSPAPLQSDPPPAQKDENQQE